MPSNPTNRGLPMGIRASGFPFDEPEQIRQGVRYRESDFPGHARYDLPGYADRPGAVGQGRFENLPGNGLKAQAPVKNLRSRR